MGVEVVGSVEGDVEDEAPEDAGEGGVASPELEGVAQAEVENLGVDGGGGAMIKEQEAGGRIREEDGGGGWRRRVWGSWRFTRLREPVEVMSASLQPS